MSTRVHLRRNHFEWAEAGLLSSGPLTVTGFRYGADVPALRVRTDRIEAVVLPFRGQQVWRFAVDGEELTMRSTFEAPTANTTDFGQSYGAFLLHCGLTGMGHPGPTDTHALHGELPNAPFQEAWLEVDSDQRGPVLRVVGTYEHRATHAYHYRFTSTLEFRPGERTVALTVDATNLRASTMPYMYLCHINWALWPDATLVQPVPEDADHFTVFPDPNEDAETAAYTRAIIADPGLSNHVPAGIHLVPEYCAWLRPVAGPDGWAHFRMDRPGGPSAWVGFEVAHLPSVIRWLSNTGDEQAAGFALPATGHHRGRAISERDHLVRAIEPGRTVTMRLGFGLVDAG